MSDLRSLWTPGAYHGSGKKRNFFEGWYFKSVSADESRSLAVIPGISLPSDPAGAHAFVMVAEPGTDRPRVFRYPPSDFRAERSRFDVAIGPNRFSNDALELDLSDDAGSVKGRLSFSGIRPWPVRAFSPGAMGWYAFVPTMECFHAVLSFDHRIGGAVAIDGAERDFTGGRGYLEKDWGVSMPASWIWLQSNHFEEEGVSLFGSIAKIPWRRRSFTGFIFGFLRRGRIHRLATYTGARITALSLDAERIRIAVEGRGRRLEIEASRTEGVELPAPSFGDMTSKVRESLRSRLTVRFTSGGPGSAGERTFAGTGRNAGLEFVGDIDELVKGLKPP
jgi:tocopherol cyclase